MKKLQNGSDIRGVALATPNGPEVNLTPETAERLARGFADFLVEKTGLGLDDLTIAVGRDPRITGEALEDAICRGLAAYGCKVYSAGLASTPAMFMATVFPEFDCDGSIMITASHMPMERNGMKFFSKEGGLEKQDISKIIEFAEGASAGASAGGAAGDDGASGSGGAAGASGGASVGNAASDDGASGAGGAAGASGGASAGGADPTHINLIDRYCSHLKSIICEALADTASQPLAGLRITVDAGNGGGGFFAEKVLKPLGADVSTSQFLEPDGTFPNHIPNPENRAAMEAIRTRVLETRTDLGLIFDTDVDRASAVDEQGKEIAHNGIVAMAAALIAEEHPGTTVVTDSVTSNELSKFLTEELGLKHLRYKRGYRNVIGKAIALNKEGIDSQLAIETSGHGAYKQNYFLDDGAYLATLIVIKAARLQREGKKISSVIANLKEPVEAREVRLPIAGDDFVETGDKIIADLTKAATDGRLSEVCLAEPNYEGVRIDFNSPEIQGWMLLRKSLHDPIMPLNYEANAVGGCKKIAADIKPILAMYPQLDISLLII